jgi:hypothetical protein
MARLSEILQAARERAQAAKLNYAGALLPHEAAELLTLAPGARLVDVRARAELDLTGFIPGATHVEYQPKNRSWPKPGWPTEGFWAGRYWRGCA